MNYNIKLSNILHDYQWSHYVFVKHVYYTSNRLWSTRVQFFHSWAAAKTIVFGGKRVVGAILKKRNLLERTISVS